MPRQIADFNLFPDLMSGIVPMSKAGSSLRALLDRADDRPIIITQKGYARGVLMTVELYELLVGLVRAVEDGTMELEG